MDTDNASNFASQIESLPEDKRRIIELLLQRLGQGHAEYGPWHVTDGRNYGKEAVDYILAIAPTQVTLFHAILILCNSATEYKGLLMGRWARIWR